MDACTCIPYEVTPGSFGGGALDKIEARLQTYMDICTYIHPYVKMYICVCIVQSCSCYSSSGVLILPSITCVKAIIQSVAIASIVFI